MGLSSIWHWLLLGLVVLLLFGKGRFSDAMGDVAKGIKSFKKGMADDEVADGKPAVEHRADETVAPSKEKTSKS